MNTASAKKKAEWDKYLDSGKYDVIMDNDGWWFCIKEEHNQHPDGDVDWEGGGDGPYGVDLLEHMLERSGIEMKWV